MGPVVGSPHRPRSCTPSRCRAERSPPGTQSCRCCPARTLHSTTGSCLPARGCGEPAAMAGLCSRRTHSDACTRAARRRAQSVLFDVHAHQPAQSGRSSPCRTHAAYAAGTIPFGGLNVGWVAVAAAPARAAIPTGMWVRVCLCVCMCALMRVCARACVSVSVCVRLFACGCTRRGLRLRAHTGVCKSG